ncbi:interferon alpha/beta receptor 1-like [Dendropsophus ebraccatus]|uniref:interferon alpha/beta receptor 1-like n=1 Tax=Dendropsophus ebraccatus TaxID=150705 RepID=UPI003831E0FF
MREDMAGRLVTGLLSVIWMAVMAAGTRETAAPPYVRISSRDALVTVDTSHQGFGTWHIILRRNGSSEEKYEHVIGLPYIISPSDLLPEQTYCVRVRKYYSNITTPEECFTAPTKGPPYNLSMDAWDTTYLLNWYWDFNQSPNATFSVEKCTFVGNCDKIKGCENITTTQCLCSDLRFNGNCILRVSVYDGKRAEKSSNVIEFTPYKETVFGPPKEIKMRIVDHELHINVSAPEGFIDTDIESLCKWRTHLEYWINSTHNSEVMIKEDDEPRFRIDPLEASTTYCAKAKKRCPDTVGDYGKISTLYSQVYCITTDPRSYLVAWITGFTILGILVISVVFYICLCPLRRYIKHIFFPPTRMPSCIEKGFEDSPLDCIKHPFLLHEEETTDRCHIVQDSNAEGLVQTNNKNTSKAHSQDSGNYSVEGQSVEETNTSDPNV